MSHVIVYRWDEDLAKRGSLNTWPRAAAERLVPEAWPHVKGSFRVPRGGSIFTVGSCFARHIEEHVHRLGYHVPTLAYQAPADEAGPVRATHALIKYTPTDVFQEISWVEGIYARDRRPTSADFEVFEYEASSGRVRDVAVATPLGVAREVTRERFEQRRRRLYEVWEAIFSADCVVVTLGLVEAWFDRERERWLLYPPTFARSPVERDRFELRILEFPDCVEYTRASLDLVRRHNPGVKFLITTSPVPMYRSYSGDDVLIANTFSKSTLRAACGALSREDDTEYFPSYENVTLTRNWSIWSRNRIHVADGFVGKIVARLTATYFETAAPSLALSQRALSELGSGDAATALELADEALAHDPRHAPTWLVAAQACQRLGRHSSVLERCARCLELDPACVAARQLVVETLLATRQLDGLDREADALAAAAPHDSNLQHLVGRARVELGDLAGARAAFETAARASQWPFFGIALARFLRETDRVDDALERLGGLVRRSPAHFEIRLELAHCLLAARRFDEAESHAEIAGTLPNASSLRVNDLLDDIREARAGVGPSEG